MGILARTLAEFPLVGKALAGSAGRSLPAAQLGYMAYGATQWSRQMNLRAYGEVGWLFVCIHRIASSVASATWHLYRRTGTDPDQREEIPRHPLLDLMRAPNPYSRRQTWHEFVMLTQAFKELTGEAAWWVGQRGGRPVELICVNPVYIDVVPDLAHFIRGFVYSANGAARIPLERDAVVWMASPNPTNEYRGLGPVTPIMPDLEAERYAVLYNRNFFLNNAEPDGIISIPGTVSPQGFQRISDQWNEKHRGVQNAHRIGLLEGDAKYTPTQFTNRDMQFDRLRQVNRQSILGAFGMPPSIVGITEAVNRSNADTAEYTYARWVIVPRLRELRDKVNQQLVPMFGDDTLELDFDDPTPADNQAQATRAELLYRGNLATRNEGRALVDLPPDETEAGDRYAFEDPIGSAPGLGDGGPLGEIDQIGAAGEDNPKAESEPAGATRRGYDPSEPRDDSGEWTSGGSVKLEKTDTRAFSGKPAQTSTPKPGKQELGALGERIAIAYLRAAGIKDAHPLNTEQNNYAVDVAGDHGAYEIKAGLAANGESAQHWRATIGQPGKAETAWLASASAEDKAALNAAKGAAILARKQAAVERLAKEHGHEIAARTIGIIIDHDRKIADIHHINGHHLRVGWRSEQATSSYVGSYKYGD